MEIFLISNGVHVDFLLPVETPALDWSKLVPREQFGRVDAGCPYLFVGWGDRGFYLDTPTWSDLKLSTLCKALFWPNGSVLHVQYLSYRPEADSSCRRLLVTPEQYRILCRHVQDSFQKNGDGAYKLIPGKSYGATDNFYEANGSYHLFNTCNMWTNGALKKMGVRTACWSPFAQAILYHLK